MKLTFEQIESVAIGTEKITCENGKYRFFRFTDEELKTIDHPNTLPPAGVRLKFRTDGTSLKLKGKTESAVAIRSYFALDVFVNGELSGSIQNLRDDECVGNYANGKYPLGEFDKEFTLGAGEKCVEIVFPHSAQVEIEEIEISDASYITPVKRKKTIVLYGDSITQGYDALHYSKSYAARLSEALEADAINKAVGGEIFRPEFAKVPTALKPDCVVVAYGTNDWNSIDLDTFKKNAEGFRDGIEMNYPDIPIFVLTPIWRYDMTDTKKCGAFSNLHKVITETFAGRKNMTVIDGLTLVPHDKELFGDLSLHPSEKGFEHYFKNLIKYFM